VRRPEGGERDLWVWALRTLLLALLLLGTVLGWNRYAGNRPIPHPPGVLVPDPPVQRPLSREEVRVWERDGYRFIPVARFELRARVLAKRVYRDRGAAVAPLDLALGWGPMSDTAVLRHLRIRQDFRFYFYSWSGKPPIPPGEMAVNSANMHMVPANDALKKALLRLRPGHLVAIRGFLVNVTGPEGFYWRTSTTRSDTGSGACEIVWVEELGPL
jgi:hypothetical protein